LEQNKKDRMRSLRTDEALLTLAREEDNFVVFEEPQQTLEAVEQIEASMGDILKRIAKLEEKNSNSQPVNKQDIAEWQQQQTKYLNETKKHEALTNQKNNLCKIRSELGRERLETFTEGFEQIQGYLRETFRMLTSEGDANLELEDSHDPFTEGVLFNVRPPGKSWCTIRALSGGEKTLASLALIFAIHQYDPAPIYVMDEIDAALDYRNVKIIANYITRCTKSAQFMIVSHRRPLFESANCLFGVYKFDDVTQVSAMA